MYISTCLFLCLFLWTFIPFSISTVNQNINKQHHQTDKQYTNNMNQDEYIARRKGYNVREAIVFLVDWRRSMTDKCTTFSSSFNDPQSVPQSFLHACLDLISHVMRDKIRNKNNDVVSVIAFGMSANITKSSLSSSSPSSRWSGVKVIRALTPCDAMGIKQIQSMLNEQQQQQQQQQRDKENDVIVEFDKVLWAARHQFTTLSSSVNGNGRKEFLLRKRVFLFTTDEDPTNGSNAIRQLSKTQARDLADMGVYLDVTLLANPNMNNLLSLTDDNDDDNVNDNNEIEENKMLGLPNPKRFFDSLIHSMTLSLNSTTTTTTLSQSQPLSQQQQQDVTTEAGSVHITTVHSFDELCNRVKRKESKKRAIRKLTFQLSPNLKIGISCFALVRKAIRPATVEIIKGTKNEPVKITTHTCEAVGSTLRGEEIQYAFHQDFVKTESKRVEQQQQQREVEEEEDNNNDDDERPMEHRNDKGGVVHGFTKEELGKVKSIDTGEVGIKLYGFRPLQYFKKEWISTSPTFIAPEEELLHGSSKLFAVLHKQMLKRKVLAIVSVKMSGNGMRFAVLIAQREKFDQDGIQLQPGGMHLHYLPYKDDVYFLWRKELVEAEDHDNDEEREEQDEEEEERNGGLGEEEEEEEEEKKTKRLKEHEIKIGRIEKNECESIALARKMIRKLKIREYNANMFENPDLTRFYNGLETAAGVIQQQQQQNENGNGNQEEEEENDDDEKWFLNPDIDGMRERAGKLMKEIVRLDAGERFDGTETARLFGTKTSIRNAEKMQRQKERDEKRELDRQKAISVCNVKEFERAYDTGDIDQFTVKELKMYCTAHDLPAKGLKRNIVMTVEDDIERRRNNKRRRHRQDLED